MRLNGNGPEDVEGADYVCKHCTFSIVLRTRETKASNIGRTLQNLTIMSPLFIAHNKLGIGSVQHTSTTL